MSTRSTQSTQSIASIPRFARAIAAGYWWTRAWNPLAMRCTPVSEGCGRCWHLVFAARHAQNHKLFSAVERAAYAGDRGPVLRESALKLPLAWRAPQIVAVQMMGDLFHDHVPATLIARVFDVIRRCPQHLFVIPTKRPVIACPNLSRARLNRMEPLCNGRLPENLLLLASVENQRRADERLIWLRTFYECRIGLSVEPLLGQIDFGDDFWESANCVHWLAVGPETGPKRRPIPHAALRSVIDQADLAGVPVFLKAVAELPDGTGRILSETDDVLRAFGSCPRELPLHPVNPV